MNLGLDGKVCVVTGATRGIGLATARMLCDEGARVLFVARDRDELARVSESCGGEFLAADVAAPEAAEQIVATAVRRLGGLDVLVNNAGTSVVRSLAELTDGDWQAQFDLHVMGPMRLMRAAAPMMAAAGGGRIVSVGSSGGKRPSSTNMSYSVTKAAQHSLTRAFADLYAKQDVLVNTVAPGPVATELWMADGGLADQHAAARGVSRDEALATQLEKVPQGRFAEPEEIAAVVVFLCSGHAGAITGATWSADGGTVPVSI